MHSVTFNRSHATSDDHSGVHLEAIAEPLPGMSPRPEAAATPLFDLHTPPHFFMDLTRRLPDEMVSQIFSLSDNSDGFAHSPTLRVSRRWREIALDCPLYWRHINFYSKGSDAVDAHMALSLRRRVEQAGTRPVSVSIRAHKNLRPGLLANSLLLLIATHLTHISHLSITELQTTQIHLVLAALARPAPTLVLFELGFVPKQHGILEISPVLLKRLFAATAPRLTTLSLVDVIIASTPGTWAMGHQIRTLSLTNRAQPQSQPQLHQATSARWQTIFPNVEALQLNRIYAAEQFAEYGPGHSLRQARISFEEVPFVSP